MKKSKKLLVVLGISAVVANVGYASIVLAQTVPGSQTIQCPTSGFSVNVAETLQYYGTIAPTYTTAAIANASVSSVSFETSSVNFTEAHVNVINYGTSNTVTVSAPSTDNHYFGFGYSVSSPNLNSSGCATDPTYLPTIIISAQVSGNTAATAGLDKSGTSKYITLKFTNNTTTINLVNTPEEIFNSSDSNNVNSGANTFFENQISRVYFNFKDLISAPSSTPLTPGSYSGTILFNTSVS